MMIIRNIFVIAAALAFLVGTTLARAGEPMVTSGNLSRTGTGMPATVAQAQEDSDDDQLVGWLTGGGLALLIGGGIAASQDSSDGTTPSSTAPTSTSPSGGSVGGSVFTTTGAGSQNFSFSR